MLGVEVVLVLGLAVLGCTMLAGRLRIASPVLLLAAGALLGFAPALRSVSLPPEAVLLLFLPALLYWDSLTTSLHQIRSNLRPIVLLATGLVVVTAGTVAVTAHALGMSWGPAWVLGAAVAPTDATAVSAIARGLPRRTIAILRTESLANDGTALVIYGLAIEVTAGHQQLKIWHVAGSAVLAYAGAVASGLVAAWLVVAVRRHLNDPLLENTVSVLTPFAAFFGAEVVHASGVLAVVVCGLLLNRTGPRVVRADTRLQAQAFWSLSTFMLNGALFVLVGMQAQAAVRGLSTTTVPAAIAMVFAISAVVIATRFGWQFTMPYLIRALDRRPQQRLRRAGPRLRTVVGACGFRGAVSLAAALAIPKTTASGEPFPGRDLIVFVTWGVVVVTLVAQALALPGLLRWARLPADTATETERLLAETTATREALDAMPRIAARLGTDAEVVAQLSRYYEQHLAVVDANGHGALDDPVVRAEADETRLRLELLANKRATIIRLRDERLIDDSVLRQVQARLDAEEYRLVRRAGVE
jgi:CPA1 family monovalent cation:H+ antiporter